MTVNPAQLTVNATGINKISDGTLTATVTLSDNRIAGDVFTDNYISATFGNADIGNGKIVGVTGISISGADAGNYTLTSPVAFTTANITSGTPGDINAVPNISNNNFLPDFDGSLYFCPPYLPGPIKPPQINMITIAGPGVAIAVPVGFIQVAAIPVSATAFNDESTFSATALAPQSSFIVPAVASIPQAAPEVAPQEVIVPQPCEIALSIEVQNNEEAPVNLLFDGVMGGEIMPAKISFEGAYSQAFMPKPITAMTFEGVACRFIMSGIPIAEGVLSKELMAGSKEMSPGSKPMPAGLVAEPYHSVGETGVSELPLDTKGVSSQAKPRDKNNK